MNIEFDNQPVYGGSDKYIKTKMFVIVNARFCYLNK